MQGSFFDASEATRRRDEAIAQVNANASRPWVDAAYRAVRFAALADPFITTEDAEQYLIAWDVETPHEPRAWGAVMRRAERAGVIQATQDWRLGKKVAAHRRPKRVWRSLLWAAR